MNTLKLRGLVAAVEKGTSIGLVALMGMLSYLVLPVTASAAELTGESTALSDPTISHAATTYTITQSAVSATSIKCIRIEFDTAANGSGSKPTGMNIASATLSGTTNIITPAGWAITNNDSSGVIILTKAAGESPVTTTNATVVLGGITNGSTANTAYYTIVNTYNSDTTCETAPSLPIDTNGISTFVFTNGVVVDATVNPTLTFTYSATTCSLLTLSVSQTKFCSHTMTAASNATSGYAISYIPTTSLSNGTHTITAINGGSGTAIASALNSEQFGINLKANTTAANTVSAFGANPSGDAGGLASANYNTVDVFAFNPVSGAQVASSTAAGATDSTIYTVSYIANINNTTPAGVYTMTQTYNITATY